MKGGVIPKLGRLPLVFLAMLALLAGIWAGCVRVGWTLPTWSPDMAAAHGPLMVSAFLGTLIALERAVALRKSWAYLGGTASGFGGLLLLLGRAGAGAALIGLASVFFLGVSFYIWRRQPVRYTLVMGLGSVCWFGGNVAWLAGWPVYRVVYFWAAFLVLTIAGERLELGRVLRHGRRPRRWFAVSTLILLGGLTSSLIDFDAGVRLIGAGFLALALWLLRYDIARHTVRRDGLPRYTAVCLLGGYAWLAVAGILAAVFGGIPAGPAYDAVLHAVFLGFVFAMIFGHAPIILPALVGTQLMFSPAMYLHLVMLHGSLMLRVLGDLLLSLPMRRWGALLNGVTLLLFLGTTVFTVLRSRSSKPAHESLRSSSTDFEMIR